MRRKIRTSQGELMVEFGPHGWHVTAGAELVLLMDDAERDALCRLADEIRDGPLMISIPSRRGPTISRAAHACPAICVP